MHCPAQITYTISQGDNLYQLSKFYQTTVTEILALNPRTDPYNLQIGSKILICPGENFSAHPGNPNPPFCPLPIKQIDLINLMRLVWSQHVYWTRMLLLSIAERLKDQEAVTERLMQNPADIARIFSNYYSPDASKTIAMLLTEHLQIGADLITSLRDRKTAKAEMLNRQWYINADKMADAFSSINPFYNRKDMQEMLYDHLDITKQEAAMRLSGNYPADIKAFDKVEDEALIMADYFSTGLMRQFPQMF